MFEEALFEARLALRGGATLILVTRLFLTVKCNRRLMICLQRVCIFVRLFRDVATKRLSLCLYQPCYVSIEAALVAGIFVSMQRRRLMNQSSALAAEET